MSIKRFREFSSLASESEDLQESSLLNKGFALTQAARHKNDAQKMISELKEVQSLSRKGQGVADLAKKLNVTLEAIEKLSRALTHAASMSSANINVTASATVLGHDVKREIKSALKKRR